VSDHRPPASVPAEVDIDVGLVRRLLAAQRPELAVLPITPFATGWDNALFRVGDALIARMPRRSVGADYIQHEIRWLAHLAPHLPLPIPVPVWSGAPGEGYPYCWSLVPWMEGTIAGNATELDLPAVATALGSFLGALHKIPVPTDAPENAYRGTPLRNRTEPIFRQLMTMSGAVDAPALRALWLRLMAVPGWKGAAVWAHGDTHPFNLLTRAGKLSAVLDWGDMHAGEPAPDLAGAWMLLPPEQHPAFREAYGGIDDETWARGRGWGLYYGVTLLAASRQGAGSAFDRVGQQTLARVLTSGDQ